MSDRDTLYDLLDGLLPEREIVRSDIAGAMVEAIEEAGWRPPACEINHRADLDALPDRSVVLDAYGDVFQRRAGRWRTCDTASLGSDRVARYGPVTVLYVPTEGTDQ